MDIAPISMGDVNGSDASVRVARKALDVQKQQGEAAVSLVESAEQNTPRPDGTGRVINTIA